MPSLYAANLSSCQDSYLSVCQMQSFQAAKFSRCVAFRSPSCRVLSLQNDVCPVSNFLYMRSRFKPETIASTVLYLLSIEHALSLTNVHVLDPKNMYNVYITLRTDSPPPLRLPWEALSKPLSALSAVYCTTCPSV